MEAIEKVRFLKIKLADPLKLLHPCTTEDRGGFYKKQSD